jgi:hypothetical protein
LGIDLHWVGLSPRPQRSTNWMQGPMMGTNRLARQKLSMVSR